MDWQTAFLTQARSDFRVLQWLTDDSGFEDCHRLHYLQMTTEKMAKGSLTSLGGVRYPNSHNAFVRFVQIARFDKSIRRRFDFRTRAAYDSFINTLLTVAQSIEDLSPEGDDHPNPEYPWEAGGNILIPARHPFSALSRHRPAVIQVMRFIEACLAE